MKELVLGQADLLDEPRRDTLRGGALQVLSSRGLRGVEALLIAALPERAPQRLLCGFDAEGSVALAARALWGQEPAITWWHFDRYVADKAAATLARGGDPVEVRCQPDLPGVTAPGEPLVAPEEPCDLVALPFPRGQEAILGRELIEEAHAALRPGGRLLAATDEPRGKWLGKVLRDVFGNANVAFEGRKRGVTFMALRKRQRAEVRDHRHLIQVTLRGFPLRLWSRPGVFGHARLDDGTRALAEACDVQPGHVTLDLGCGYGALALVAAQLAPEGRVVGVDSSTRAASLAARNAEENQLQGRVRALLRAGLEDLGEPAFDRVLANPPYFSNWRIAGAFVDGAARLLRPEGELWLVAKAAERHAELLGERFRAVRILDTPRGHGIVVGTRV